MRPAVLAQARDFSPLLNALYCYSDINQAMLEGKKWRWAPTYYRVASSEIQASLLGEVTERTLIKVFAAVFFLMLSEVCLCLLSGEEIGLRLTLYTPALFVPRTLYIRDILSPFCIPFAAALP